MCVSVHMECVSGSQKTNCRSCFSPLIMYFLGTELRFQGLAASACKPAQSSHWPWKLCLTIVLDIT